MTVMFKINLKEQRQENKMIKLRLVRLHEGGEEIFDAFVVTLSPLRVQVNCFNRLPDTALSTSDRVLKIKFQQICEHTVYQIKQNK